MIAAQAARYSAAFILSIAVLAGSLAIGPAQAHDARRYFKLAADVSQLSLPPAIVAEPSSSVPLRISVPSPRDLPPNSFLRLRGLPPALALSDGHAIAPGVWAVPLASLSALRLIVPVGVGGNAEVVVALVSVDGAVLAEGRIALTITDQTGSMVRGPQTSVLANPAAALSPEARERAVKLVQRGELELSNGNVAQARGFFLRAAEAGLANGALMLASTYDPGELVRLKVQGVQPNPAEARKWYEKARELGAPEANDRLVALSKR